MRRRDAAPRDEQLLAIDRQQAAKWYLVALAGRQTMRRRPATARIVQIDRVGAARDGVAEMARLEHVVARQRVAPDDSPRLADADLSAGRGNARVFETRHAFAKKIE